MTEQEWLAATDPTPMLEFVRDSASERQLRLFAVSAIWPLLVSLADPATQEVAGVISEVAEGRLSRGALRDEQNKIGTFTYPTVPASSASDYITRAAGLSMDSTPLRAALKMVSAVTHLSREHGINVSTDQMSGDLDIRRQCNCRLAAHVHDIFGNPFGSTGIERRWRTSTALALAQGMYDSRDFSAMPILADALQDAGCDNDEVLAHCRGRGPHVRGCFVVDLLLGKA